MNTDRRIELMQAEIDGLGKIVHGLMTQRPRHLVCPMCREPLSHCDNTDRPVIKCTVQDGGLNIACQCRYRGRYERV